MTAEAGAGRRLLLRFGFQMLAKPTHPCSLPLVDASSFAEPARMSGQAEKTSRSLKQLSARAGRVGAHTEG
jgi:hypothetical protein